MSGREKRLTALIVPMMIQVLTAEQAYSRELQKGTRWSAPKSKVEADAIAANTKFNHTHVAVCEGVLPIIATIAGETMTIGQSGGGDDYWEETISVSSEKDAINKLVSAAAENAKAVFSNL